MIVCLCASVNDRTIEGLVARGVTGARALGKACGAGEHCGSCIADLDRLSRDGGRTALPVADAQKGEHSQRRAA